jgi:glycosyltransferase involved in cell wall biosynthesis
MPDVAANLASRRAHVDAGAAAARKPRVVIVGHSAGQVLYGAERSLLDVLAAVDRQQYEVSCIFPNGNDEYLRAVAKFTKNITVFPYQWWSKTRPFDQRTVSRFEKVFRRERADLVHVNTITLNEPLLAAQRLHVPSIVHTRELINHDTDLAALFGDDVSTIVSTIRAAADFIIANSDATHRLYSKGDRSFRLYNCVDIERFNLINNFEPGKLKVGIISSNLPKKGIEQFVKLAVLASRRRPQLEFLVIGPHTEHTTELDRMVRAEGIPVNLRFTGYIPDSVEAMRQVNVVVSFSIFAESFGRTIAEAMAARRPVIAYRWGATPELVRDGKDGFLIPYLDFAKALGHLETMSDNPDLVSEMGRNGRERAQRLFAPDMFATNLNGIYQQVIDAWKAREPTSVTEASNPSRSHPPSPAARSQHIE